MQIIRTKFELAEIVKNLKKQCKIIGFVPTMGALHEGHLSLIDIARNNSDVVIVSIFVNPSQFAPNEDFDKYPRTEKSDIDKLKSKKVDIAYLPPINEIYKEGASATISIGRIGKILEGIARPHLFDGVALIVTKLFMQTLPDIAVFGEKDFQQFITVQKLVRELDIPTKIIGAPICRENDGLAMSSRNIYLPKNKRRTAANFYKVLNLVKENLYHSEIEKALSWGKEELIRVGFEEVYYLELCSSINLNPLRFIEKPARLLGAVRLADIRLLDNIDL